MTLSIARQAQNLRAAADRLDGGRTALSVAPPVAPTVAPEVEQQLARIFKGKPKHLARALELAREAAAAKAPKVSRR